MVEAEEQPPKLHPECIKMHKCSYCICLIVTCMKCEWQHPPHKPCPEKEKNK